MSKLIPKDKYVVHPCATGFGDEYLPAVGIDFEREDGTLGSAYRLLRDRGVYQTLEVAMMIARGVQVESVDEDGVVRVFPVKQ